MSAGHSAGTKRYMLADALSAYMAWLLFFAYRKRYIEQVTAQDALLLDDPKFWGGGFLIAIYWWLVFTLSNSYYSIYEKSRLTETIRTTFISLGGNILLFFVLVLNDNIQSYRDYYWLFAMLLGTHLLMTLFFRLFLLFKAKDDMRSGKVSFRTLWIGQDPAAEKVFKELQLSSGEHGLQVTDIISEGHLSTKMDGKVRLAGQLEDLPGLLLRESFEYAVVALSPDRQAELPALIQDLDEHGIRIKIIPEMRDILSGQARLSNVTGTLLADVHTHVMEPWERVLKRAFDIAMAVLAFLVTWPLMLYIAIRVKQSSEGPVLYRQERIGYRGKPFRMLKFRSMYLNAEENGPMLSFEEDPRVTPFGKFIRKYRLDELPQFYHVLTGEMSLVGPRPERAFYAAQLIDKAPHYKYIYKVKPGITSWGMVRYGYAGDLDRMLERLPYDLLYVENFSFLLDLKILIHTVLIILKGRGV
jgi:polysaccharide biosynthesis protein PslA